MRAAAKGSVNKLYKSLSEKFMHKASVYCYIFMLYT